MHNPLLDRLLSQLKLRGLRIAAGKPGELLLSGPQEERTPEIMAALKAFKPQLLERFGQPGTAREPSTPEDERQNSLPSNTPISPPMSQTEACRLCRRELSETDRTALATNPQLCDRFGNPRCPYKESSHSRG